MSCHVSPSPPPMNPLIIPSCSEAKVDAALEKFTQLIEQLGKTAVAQEHGACVDWIAPFTTT